MCLYIHIYKCEAVNLVHYRHTSIGELTQLAQRMEISEDGSYVVLYEGTNCTEEQRKGASAKGRRQREERRRKKKRQSVS